MQIFPRENLPDHRDVLGEQVKEVDKNIPFSTFRQSIEGKGNLQKSVKKVFVIAQIFGYLPVQGISGPDHRSLSFTWSSSRVVYCILTILGAAFVSVMQMHKIITKGMDLLEIDRFFFNFLGVVSGILFLLLSKNWPKLMKDWSVVEISMVSYGRPVNLNRTNNILLGIFMAIALIEHLLTQCNKLVLSFECNNSTQEAFNYFFSDMSFSHIFSIINYNIVIGLILQAINLQLTFMWTFIDVFIMIISTSLAQRFTQITDRIKSITNAKIVSEIIWKNLREDYNRLCKLCKRVDEQISYIVLLAFTSDLFFILVQLFNSLRQRRNMLERVYFYSSFGLLIVRTICLCLFGAKVNDESKKPLIVLNSVSSRVYNLEIQRFIQQIGTSEVAITGRNFFSITRGLILSIAGAIVTYELVLIQFNDNLLKDKDRAMERPGVCPTFV